MNIPFLMIGTTEVIVLGAVVLLLFGGKKIPELMRSLGSGVKSFKEGMAEGEKKDETTQKSGEQNKKADEMKSDATDAQQKDKDA